MEHYELRLLADYLGGAQAVNVWARPSPTTVVGELQRDERAEVVFAEIWSPVTGAGVEEELKKIIPVLDGDKYGEYVSLSGIRSSVMAPPKGRIWGAKLYSFGTPMSNNPLLSTTLKYSESITVETMVGATTAITQPYRVRLWGYIYKVDELPRVFGTMGGGIPGHPDLFALLVDRARGRELPIRKATIGGIPVNGDTWRTLPGGKDQSIPKINPLIRYAYNLAQTDAKGGDYQFRYQTSKVAESEENMYFDFDSLDAILVEGLGIRPDTAGHLAKTALKIAGDYHPKRLIPTTLTNNPLHFGWADPFFPSTIPLYYAIPKLERPYLIWNEIGQVIAQDGGTTAVVINALIAALTGIRIEMKGG
ncbi:unnamed protein product [marine sediment metagenome]|uniref:Uncharacterized protein n=1 Tax=marine sediment metagenome TaxID=412755 RepID=X1RMB2_9ZZZZ